MFFCCFLLILLIFQLHKKEVFILNSSIVLLLLLQVILIALNAIFACAEIAVLSVNETKLDKMAEQGNKKAGRLNRLIKEPAKFLATIQVAITLSGFLGSAFAAENFSEPLVDWVIGLGINIPRSTLETISIILITIILSYFTLIFGELVPKRVAMKKAESFALGISGLISGISVIFKPIVWLLSISTNAVLRLMGIDPTETEEQVSEEEIRMMVDAGGENGSIDKEEQKFIQNVFEFDDLTADEIATHRTDIVILWLEDSMEEWEKTIHDNRHTRYPICSDSPDNVVGILNTKDYYRLDDKSRESVMQTVYPAYFVPETIKADVLFRNMRQNHKAMAVVLDEYGGVVGIITLNDLLERLVGDLNEEVPANDEDVPHINQVNENTWDIIGNVGLYDIEQALDVDIGQEDVDTFTGLVFSELDMIPKDGLHDISLDFKGLHIHVTQVKDHQIEKARITKLAPPEESEDDD